MIDAGELRDRVQFRRATTTIGALDEEQDWSNFGGPVWARVSFVSDGERWRAAQVQAQVTARVMVRWSTFSSGVTAEDRLLHLGAEYQITEIKPVEERNTWLELTVSRVADRA
ncbi:head-tail adaptor protein [Cereibacter sphaeroides]|nr:head-tail adaptor protein [Cereibacter sphaeroides]